MSDYQLSQIAIMHYINGLSQQEIANMFGLSKMTVSRMLQKAKDQGIVKTDVKLPFAIESRIGSKLQKKYRLNQVWVVDHEDNDSNETVRDLLAGAAAFFFNTSLSKKETIGIGIGKTIGAFVKHLTPMKTSDVHIVQLMGGLPDVTRENPFTIMQETCRKLEAKGTLLTSFAIADNQKDRDSFINHNETGKLVHELWKTCSLALFGVGMIEKGTILSPKLLSEEEMDQLKSQNAIGDVLGHCFTLDGDFIHSDLESRLVSILIDLLLRIKTRRAIAFGVDKVPAIHGALQANIMNELFTDSTTAEKLLQQ